MCGCVSEVSQVVQVGADARWKGKQGKARERVMDVWMCE